MSWSWGVAGNNNVTLRPVRPSVTIMTNVDIIDCQYQGFVYVIIIMDSKLTLHLYICNNIIMSANI